MKKKREYTHEDMERLGEEIEELSMRARQADHDIQSGVISHEQWVSAARELLGRKEEILGILSDVDRYEQEVRREIEKERNLRMAAEERIAVLEARARCNND